MADWIPCYQIADGDRYEVNDSNGVWKPGQTKRAGPLPFIRWKVNGHAWGPGYRAFLEVATKKYAAMCLGVFGKLLELAGNQPRELRWALLDHQGVPFTPPAIADAIGFAKRDVERALEVLVDSRVTWIELGEWNCQARDFRGLPGTSGEIPFRSGQVSTGQGQVSTGQCARASAFAPPTLEEVAAYCRERAAAGKPPIDPQLFHDHYTARNWKPKGYTTQMSDWKAAVRTWERNELRKGTQDGKPRRRGSVARIRD
jgi:hypothetical protein